MRNIENINTFFALNLRDKTGEALKLLLAHGVDPNIANNDVKSTPLHLAVKEANDNAVRILVQTEKCDVNLQVRQTLKN
jgi:ankyrin repeat protein